MQYLWTSVPEDLSFYSALFSYGLFASLALGENLSLTTSGPGPGELLGYWGFMIIRHVPIPTKGIG